MNSDRLRNVVEVVSADATRLGLPALLESVEEAYTRSVQQSTPEQIDAFRAALESLREACAQSNTNEFSVSRRRTLASLGGADFCGDALVKRVEAITGGGGNLAKVLQEIQLLREGAVRFYEQSTRLEGSPGELGIESQSPPSGEAEVEVLLPGVLVNDNLEEFAAEARKLNLHLSTIVHALTGDRPHLVIRALSTGSPIEIVLSLPAIDANGLLTLVNSIVLLITSVITLRATTKQAEQNFPEEISAKMRDYAKQRVSEGIEEIVQKILSDHPPKSSKGKGSRKPLDGDDASRLRRAVEHLADRIDRGMDVDVTTGYAPPEPTSEEPGEGQKARELPPASPEQQSLRAIRENRSRLRLLKREAEPVLQLTPGSPDDDAADEKK